MPDASRTDGVTASSLKVPTPTRVVENTLAEAVAPRATQAQPAFPHIPLPTFNLPNFSPQPTQAPPPVSPASSSAASETESVPGRAAARAPLTAARKQPPTPVVIPILPAGEQGDKDDGEGKGSGGGGV